jgi:hypothetical protein
MEGAPREIRKTREVEGRRLEGWKVYESRRGDEEVVERGGERKVSVKWI